MLSLAARVRFKSTQASIPRVSAGVKPSARVRSLMPSLAVAGVARPRGVPEGAGEGEEAV